MIIQLAGYLSGIAILLSFVPYIRDILRGVTKPERTSWFIWSILGFTSFFSQLAKGASYSLGMTGAQAAGDLVIFFLAIKYGLGGFKKRDIFGLIGVAFGIVLWILTHEASIALFIVIFIDGVGALLTALKAYEHPTTETVSSWVLTFIGGVFASFAVGSFNFILLAFPLYISLASASILFAIWLGSRHGKKSAFVS
ncbi:MAG: hypothetical protein Q8R20_00110 [Nanoarchaeota archaeon]|nr:hypothetical protein [Nanoarchaeota archaeon]